MIGGVVLVWLCLCGNDNDAHCCRGCEDDWWNSLSVLMFLW